MLSFRLGIPGIPAIIRGFEMDANGQITTGIDVNHGFWQLMNGATKRVENNVVRGVSGEASRGEYRYGINVFNNTTNLPTGFAGTYPGSATPNTDGLSLQAGSSGLDAGTALATTYSSTFLTNTRRF